MMRILFICLFTIPLLAQQERDLQYIKDHAELAVQEMELYKIPASITLAQGILETGGGQSRLAEKAFNHFGIKCKVEWTGDRIYHDDDAKGECFRKYASVKDSYRDHSKFLAERPYYKALFKLDILDYKGWSYGLKKAGYATNPNYAPLLISRIEKYNLHDFDKMKSTEVAAYLAERFKDPTLVAKVEPKKEVVVAPKPEKKPVPEKKIVVEKREAHPKTRIKKHVSGNTYVVRREGESLADLARIYDISESKLKKYNDLSDNKLYEGQPVFFKKKKSKGVVKVYKAKKGETAYSISQDHGIQYRKLLKRNRLYTNVNFEGGETVYLQGKKKK